MRRFCAIAEISRKSYCSHLKSLNDPSSDKVLVTRIQAIQQKIGYGCGYRQITRQLNWIDTIGPINRKRVYRLMQEHDLLSAVRRKKFTPKQYFLRRVERKDCVPTNLVKRDFSQGTKKNILY